MDPGRNEGQVTKSQNKQGKRRVLIWMVRRRKGRRRWGKRRGRKPAYPDRPSGVELTASLGLQRGACLG